MTRQKLKLPVPVVLQLPKAELSAREAMQQLEPMSGWLQAPWTHYQVNYSTSSQMGVRGWGWDFRYLNTTTRAMVYAYLYSNGNSGFGDLGKLPPTINPQTLGMSSLPEKWLDSSVIFTIATALVPPKGFNRTNVIEGSNLSKMHDAEARWKLSFSSGPEASDYQRYVAEFQRHEIEFDALTGEVLRETIGRPAVVNGVPMIRTVRERIRAGEWQDVRSEL